MNFKIDKHYKLLCCFHIGATWCLTSVVFIYVYTGVLTSLLAVPNYIPIINTLDELAASSTLKPVTIRSTAVDDMMLVSN